MKRKLWKVLKTALIIAVIAGLGWGGYRYVQSRRSAEQGEVLSYSRIRLSPGSLSQRVISTGSLGLSQMKDMRAPFDLSTAEVPVLAGDEVRSGDVLIRFESDQLWATIKALETEISALDGEILSLASRHSDTTALSAGASGRLKAVYAAQGEQVREVMARDGGLALLSLDGKMKITVPAQTGVMLGADYIIQYGNTRYTGTVDHVEGGNMTLTFPDTRVLPGETVQVVQGSAVIAEGKAHVNLPYLLGSFLNARVKSIPAVINGTLSRATRLIELDHLALSDEYMDKVKERADKWAELQLAQALMADPVLYAPNAGIVAEVTAAEGKEALKDEILFSLYVGDSFEMEVTVDELDITKIKTGQQASIVMDALPDESYEARVSRISQLGQSSGGITGYQVTLSVSGDDQLKLGMNGTATILTGEQADVLLIPLSALQSDRQGSYVWLYREGYEATREAPGVKTYVTTGLSDTDYAAVTSGLQAGEEVLVVRAAGADSPGPGTSFSMPGGGEGTFNRRTEGGSGQPGGGSFPGGGNRP